MRLTPDEQKMLNGDYGPLKREAMARVVQYAEVVEAPRLCDVTMAHLFCGAHHYLEAMVSKDFDEVHSEMSFVSQEKLVFAHMAPGCMCQSDVFPISANNWPAMTDDEERVRLNEHYLKRFEAMGVRLVGTCIPYMTGFIPLAGEHYVSSESHAVLLINSLWSACGHAMARRPVSGRPSAAKLPTGVCTCPLKGAATEFMTFRPTCKPFTTGISSVMRPAVKFRL